MQYCDSGLLDALPVLEDGNERLESGDKSIDQSSYHALYKAHGTLHTI